MSTKNAYKVIVQRLILVSFVSLVLSCPADAVNNPQGAEASPAASAASAGSAASAASAASAETSGAGGVKVNAVNGPQAQVKNEPIHPCGEQCEIGTTGQVAIWGTIALFVFGMGATISRLKRDDNSWKLSEALSEKSGMLIPAAAVPTGPPAAPPPAVLDGAPVPPACPATPADGALVASSSRLIAFLGMIAILSVFFGFGLYILWAVFTSNTAQLGADVKAVGTYFLYGSALFTPYAFNQVKDAFKS